MKYVALFSLIIQTVAVIYFMRVSRIKKSNENGLYFNTCAVVMSEIVKLVFSLLIIFQEKKYCIRELINTLRNEVFHSIKSNFLVGVPGLLYVVQNNLLFIALSNLPGAVYHVTYQLKILVTAVLSVVIMKRKLSKKKWFSLLLLTTGAIMVQPGKGNSSLNQLESQGKDAFLGLCSVLLACITSGLAGVFLEKLLKDDNTTIWGRNIQLALYGIIFGYICCITGKDGVEISEKGFFYGFNTLVWLVILLQAIGGIIVAAVLKYADNILKCFGNSISIIMSCILSWHLGDYNISLLFVLGSCLVIWSIFIYGLELIFPCTNLFIKFKYLLKKNSRNNIVTKYKTLREKSSENGFDLVNIEEVIPKGVQMAIISNNV
ncbi:nucleotide-sugar transporter [Cryptosporidium xiaoi]|uniref:Nucleotide-sugar transporter n=1 Tax=Cryptosporidium xiaoi TaxID=659607 RepID=A0AAV9XVR4_9CRYT